MTISITLIEGRSSMSVIPKILLSFSQEHLYNSYFLLSKIINLNDKMLFNSFCFITVAEISLFMNVQREFFFYNLQREC